MLSWASAASPALPFAGSGDLGAWAPTNTDNATAVSSASGDRFISSPAAVSPRRALLLWRYFCFFQSGRALGKGDVTGRISVLLQNVGGDGIIVLRLQ